ncbi:HsdR family type I site-specific deoxyribonuclease [bacterium]|nr:HsdR family type I site-specific deoxyribonuclease [bacterium]
MSEYSLVEKPFLEQLGALGWIVVDQGPAYPTDPSQSLRESFRETILRDIFFQSVRDINLTEDGQEWLTDAQLEELLVSVSQRPGESLTEANESILKLLLRHQVDENELTGEQYPNVQLIDFHHPERNHFFAINQFRIDTPGCVDDCIIPDIVLFVNGMPLAVVECKLASATEADPMCEAFVQLMRYSGRREATTEAGLREGEPELFYTNQLLIRTTGEEAQFGTITSTDEEYFYPWRDIWPTEYAEYEPPLGQEREQEILIQGMLPKATLLDLVRNCTVFMDVDDGKARAKVVARYQQYRAVLKIIDRLRTGQTQMERSGVIWHTQGSGKSLTMVFAIRKLRMCEDLKDYKVVLINDRVDLEEQLSKTARLTGEPVTVIDSTAELRHQLATDASNLNMVMVHKFQEVQGRLPDYLESVLTIPRYETFGTINGSDRILLMVDEAHRTQSGDLGDNLFYAFPNAAKLAFTGTPLIVTEEGNQTARRFAGYIDKYKLHDAERDHAVVRILYEGKASNDWVGERATFDKEVDTTAAAHVTSQLRKESNVEKLSRWAREQQRPFEDLLKEHTAAEIAALKARWGTYDNLLEADKRIAEIAKDLVKHYVEEVLPNGFKAQVVCGSKMAAVRYKQHIDAALAAMLADEQAKPPWHGDPREIPDETRTEWQDAELCSKLTFLQSVVVVSPETTNERAVITEARRHAQSVNAVENFKAPFNQEDPEKVNTGIAFLIVCDMLLTGFDAPIEQVMYIDKHVQNHNLLQTIARVNRVAKGKRRGYIVDYIGLANHLKEALSIYAADDQRDIEDTFRDISSELPILEERYQRLLHLFVDDGVTGIEDFVQQRVTGREEAEVCEQAIVLMENVELRATFEVYLERFLQSLDIILPHEAAMPYKVPAKRFAYLLFRIRDRYRDETLSISDAGEKIRRIIDAYLLSEGIDPKVKPTELLSPRFVTEVQTITTSRAKASTMEHAIRRHLKANYGQDPALYAKLSDRLDALIKQYQDNWEALSKELEQLRLDIEAGRTDSPQGVSARVAPFYALMGQIAFGEDIVPPEQANKLAQLADQAVEMLRSRIGIVDFWNNQPEVTSLRGDLSDILLMSEIDGVVDKVDKLVTELLHLAKYRHADVMRP